jgi:hypothetical protein
MKSKFPVRSLLSLLLAVTVVSIAVPAGRVFAQSSAEDRKIRLMADVLRLRDSGDYAGALISLDQLSAVAPNDASVARLRTEITSAARARCLRLKRPGHDRGQDSRRRAAVGLARR